VRSHWIDYAHGILELTPSSGSPSNTRFCWT
jgi:hypothetical protein